MVCQKKAMYKINLFIKDLSQTWFKRS